MSDLPGSPDAGHASASLPESIRAIAASQVERLAAAAAGLDDADLAAPTRCAGWLAAHLLAHIRSGLAEHATSFTEPVADGTADRDYVSYWRDFPASSRPPTYAEVRFYWATGSSYATADSLRRHFSDTARQAAGMSRQTPDGLFRFQGHVMASADILAMWTAEWVIHQLDLTAFLPGERPEPAAQAVALAVRTLDGLTGGRSRPPAWGDKTYLLKGAGRLPLDAADRAFLGTRAAAFPAFG